MVFQQWWLEFLPSLECCQSQVTKTHKEQVLVDAAPISATPYTGLGYSTTPPTELLPLTPSTTASDSERLESMDEEERRAQKSRLNAVLKSFARAGYLGVDCKVLSVNDYADAKFFLDAGLEHLIISKRGKDDNMIPVIDVMKVYSYAELIEHVGSSPIGDGLWEEHRDSSIFIQHQAPTFQKQEHWLCLLLADAASRARFVTCLRILCLYVRANLSESSKSGKNFSEASKDVVAEIPKLDMAKVPKYY